jgi:phosphoribosylformylglycinamidine cyclo-ligase
VDIGAGDKAVRLMKRHAKSTFSENVLTGIGHFGAFYELPKSEYKNPVMVSSVDGVGTKLKIAIEMDNHGTIGQDLVNHCVNDIAVCGAKPLYFMDYLAFARLDPSIAAQIVKGFSKACRMNGVSLIGGETAEMPGLYKKGDYDISGTIVGIVEKSKIIDGTKVSSGDTLIGYRSSGLHTNGYSLARKVLLSKYKVTQKLDFGRKSLGEELLTVHKSYLKLINELTKSVPVKAFSHITGGGIIGNTKRVIPKGLKIDIDWQSWKRLPIFDLIQKTGNIDEIEMRNVFNLGIGLIAVVRKKDVEKVLDISNNIGEKGKIVGRIE